ncbi:MAG: hypothetical protein HC932_01400 [Thermales bacterium]|nr:hypothetical protein [Thermales bacterium]
MNYKKTTILTVIFFGLGLIFRIIHINQLGHYFDIITTQAEWGKNAYQMGILNFWKNYSGYFDYMPLSVVFESWIYSLVKNTKDPYFGFNVILKNLQFNNRFID